jgi:hypothetical protein
MRNRCCTRHFLFRIHIKLCFFTKTVDCLYRTNSSFCSTHDMRFPGRTEIINHSHIKYSIKNISYDHMGHTIKNQRPYEYRPSATRRASGLAPVSESRENAVKRWNKLRQHIKSSMSLARNIRTKGVATRGRFRVRNVSPPRTKSPPKHSVMLNKNKPPGVYFVSKPYKKGRFNVENIYGFVPFPKKR